MRHVLCLVLCLIFGGGLTAASAQGTALKTVTMLLPGQVGPGTDFMWLGVDEGIFKRHGIDLQIDAPASVAGASAVALLDPGKYDVGYLSSLTLLKARQETHSQLVQFYGLLQGNPSCFLVRKSANMKSLADLKGKRIVLASSSNNATLLAQLAKHGITPDTAKIEYAATAAQFGAFIQGAADAIATSAYSNQPNLRIAHGIDTTAFCQRDDGFDYQLAGLAAGAGYLAANRDLMRELVAAIGETFKAAAADPRATGESMMRHFPNLAPPVEVAMASVRAMVPYFGTPNTKGMPPGKMSTADWNTTKAIAVKYFELNPDFDISAAWTSAAFDKGK